MLSKTTIPIRNIFYMLAYSHKELKEREYTRVGSESFDNVLDLYSTILLISVSRLLKGGLIKDYISLEEDLFVIKGKLNLNKTISRNTLYNKKIVVDYDEYSTNILFNKIIKSTLIKLSRSKEISVEKRRSLKKLIPYFTDIDEIILSTIKWHDITFNNNSYRYRFTLKICEYIFKELIINDEDDLLSKELYDERRLSNIYENFVLNFYKQETSYHVSSPQIKWKVEEDVNNNLPIMQTDIVVKKEDRIIIIDTKFYTKNMLKRSETSKEKHISNNLYQIFTYVNNYVSDFEDSSIEGILLYAKTDEEIQANDRYLINDNKISILNLDLNEDFESIKENLFKVIR